MNESMQEEMDEFMGVVKPGPRQPRPVFERGRVALADSNRLLDIMPAEYQPPGVWTPYLAALARRLGIESFPEDTLLVRSQAPSGNVFYVLAGPVVSGRRVVVHNQEGAVLLDTSIEEARGAAWWRMEVWADAVTASDIDITAGNIAYERGIPLMELR